MKHAKRVLVFAIIAFAAVSASAQVKKMKWDSEFCQYEGTYDSKKYSESQLRATIKLLDSFGSVSLMTESNAWEYEDIDKLSVEKLDAEYKTVRKEFEDLDIVDVEYWKDLKKQKLAAIDQEYKMSRAQILGYKDPARLLDFECAESCKTEYVEPLIAGGDKLLEAWRKLIEKRAKDNASEMTRYTAENASPDRLKYAQISVMTFGWSNCANDSIKYIEFDETHNKEFEKLFKKVRTIECEEPE
ncbi:MAG: hypothetical protein R2684_14595 [Pyrinomonadaceae bacterium]